MYNVFIMIMILVAVTTIFWVSVIKIIYIMVANFVNVTILFSANKLLKLKYFYTFFLKFLKKNHDASYEPGNTVTWIVYELTLLRIECLMK
jgi:hypothetical protein